jgi:hypothetical protein
MEWSGSVGSVALTGGSGFSSSVCVRRGVRKERHRHRRAAKRDLTVEDLAAGGGADETGRRPALAECRGDLGAVRGVEDAGEDLDQDRSGCLLGGE